MKKQTSILPKKLQKLNNDRGKSLDKLDNEIAENVKKLRCGK